MYSSSDIAAKSGKLVVEGAGLSCPSGCRGGHGKTQAHEKGRQALVETCESLAASRFAAFSCALLPRCSFFLPRFSPVVPT